MPSRNLFILAAAMQLPLALWLHGCKDDKDDDNKGDNNQTDNGDNTQTDNTDNTEKPPASEKLHAKYFLTGAHKELLKDMKNKVDFKVRNDMFNQEATETTAVALASFINESTEGMVSLYGCAFKYETLLKEWRPEYVADVWDVNMGHQNVAPGTVSTNALQHYMIGKPNPVMFSPYRFTGGNVMAQTKIVDAVGAVDVTVFQTNQFNQQIPQRNLIVTELYHGAYGTVAFPPKRNPHNLAVTFFQVSQDLDDFFEVCVRAFNQVLAVNQMFALTTKTEIQKIWDETEPTKELENAAEQKKEFPQLTAWEVLDKKVATDEKSYIRMQNYGSRKPHSPARNEHSIHINQMELIKHTNALRQKVKDHFHANFDRVRIGAFQGRHLNIAESKDFQEYLEYVISSEIGTDVVYLFEIKDDRDRYSLDEPNMLDDFDAWKAGTPLNDEVKFTGFAPAFDKPVAGSVIEGVVKIKEFVDLIWNDYEARSKMQVTAIKGWASGPSVKDFVKTYGELNDLSEDVSVDIIEANTSAACTEELGMPSFIFDLLMSGKSLVPEKAGQLAFEQFARELRGDNCQYILPKKQELMSLKEYHIDVLEVIHPGKNTEIAFAEVMLAAFMSAHRDASRSSQAQMQSPSNYQVIFGDASAIYGHNGIQNVNQMPYTAMLEWKKSMMMKTLRFVTLSSMTEGEDAVECWEKIAERLITVDVEVTISEHVEVSKEKLKALPKGSKGTIKQHIRTMQQ